MQNNEKTEDIRDRHIDARPLDSFDRKILSELARDAGLSYAELGRLVGLSAPAVHERVKRLRTAGRIRGTVAVLDGPSTGKPLLAFVHVDTMGWGKTQELLSLAELPELEEIHSVAGDTCMLLKVRCKSSRALEGLLAKLYATPGVKATRSYVVLSTYLERTPQGGITEALESEHPVIS
ncbi:AsnC family transcriptional regulator [Litchfieldella qijiaojingensis]|uniref:AsnC family transcriptional regulator n=1 Tax=Litchfieldella qijiaojingensis TaxID=980347 RepID=A0ABQ2YPK2_9GAMM|nr:Lrp/AsnC family transcriptional regulator [Halomonas qijiaojingensis]GGX89571.1 AsnC family transcriptional regulator [Halomonas qijiaojingensis]